MLRVGFEPTKKHVSEQKRKRKIDAESEICIKKYASIENKR